MGDASPVIVGASAAVSGVISAYVIGVGIAIVDEARPHMDRVIAAAVVVGIVIIAIAGSYRHVDRRGAAPLLDPDNIVSRALAGSQKGRPGRYGSGDRIDGERSGRQQASHRSRCQSVPVTHWTSSMVP
jgi:hypothetical protein